SQSLLYFFSPLHPFSHFLFFSCFTSLPTTLLLPFHLSLLSLSFCLPLSLSFFHAFRDCPPHSFCHFLSLFYPPLSVSLCLSLSAGLALSLSLSLSLSVFVLFRWQDRKSTRLNS